MQNGTAKAAHVELDTDTKAVTYAAITLTGPSLSLPLTFTSSGSYGTTFMSYYDSTAGWSYQANKTYTMAISYDGHSYSSSVTSGGNVSFATGVSGVTIAWVNSGDLDNAVASCNSPVEDYSYGPQITSPYIIPQASLVGHTSGNYLITMNSVEELFSNPFSGGAYSGSTFSCVDTESTAY